MISEFGEERILCCSCDPVIKDTSVIQSETTNLQQRVNSLTQEVLRSTNDTFGLDFLSPGILKYERAFQKNLACSLTVSS